MWPGEEHLPKEVIACLVGNACKSAGKCPSRMNGPVGCTACASTLKGWWGAHRRIMGIELSDNCITVEILTHVDTVFFTQKKPITTRSLGDIFTTYYKMFLGMPAYMHDGTEFKYTQLSCERMHFFHHCIRFV
jgi:hypothetical protein